MRQMTIVQLPFESDHPAFSGHFPGQPIVPGVQLLDRAQHVIEAQCQIGLCGLQVAKFLSPAIPGDALELEYAVAGNKVRFEIRCGTRRIATGEFLVDEGSLEGSLA